MGENIGAVARAMLNFGLVSLRLVSPRDRWPNPKAEVVAVGADAVMKRVRVEWRLEDALADATLVIAATARPRYLEKPVWGPRQAAERLRAAIAAGERPVIMFGPEAAGLETEEVARADAILTLPVNPGFASLNLAQAVALVAYEWCKLASGGKLPFTMPIKSPARPASASPPRTKARKVCLTASRRLLWRPSTCKSRAAMLPETSTTMTMAIPSLYTLMACIPRCGRARATMHSTRASPRSAGRTQRSRAARDGGSPVRSAIEA